MKQLLVIVVSASVVLSSMGGGGPPLPSVPTTITPVTKKYGSPTPIKQATLQMAAPQIPGVHVTWNHGKFGFNPFEVYLVYGSTNTFTTVTSQHWTYLGTTGTNTGFTIGRSNQFCFFMVITSNTLSHLNLYQVAPWYNINGIQP